VGALLSVAAAGEVIQAGALLWRSVMGREPAFYGLLVLDQLLLVLMMVELLHTVRISVRSQTLIMEPFLIVGLIASIRRVLVITMQAAKMTEQGQPQAGEAASAAFRNTMVELGLLGFLILVFVFAIYLLRRSSSPEELVGK
jgi:F0F1-type ATP synthase assembly protein I